MIFQKLNRRQFLQALGTGAVASPVLAITACSDKQAAIDLPLYVAIDQNRLIFILPRSEMGQDIHTSFAMLIAEEMDAPLDTIQCQFASASDQIPDQLTVGSSSVRNWWIHMRQVGAGTRMLLLKEAARQSKIPAEALTTHQGKVISKDGTWQTSYIDLLSNLSLESEVVTGKLKPASEFSLIGQSPPSLSNREKVTGHYQYLQDLPVSQRARKLMVVAYQDGWPLPSSTTLAQLKEKYQLDFAGLHSHRFGGFDHRVFLSHRKTWPLTKAKNDLETLRRNQLKEAPSVTESAFDMEVRKQQSTQFASQEEFKLAFVTPAIAHIAMEPCCASIHYTPDYTEVWAPTQGPDLAREALIKHLNQAKESIHLHTIAMGGAFGRKRFTDYLEELAVAAKTLFEEGLTGPLCLHWTREDDFFREHYRPASLQVMHWHAHTAPQFNLAIHEGYRGASRASANLPRDLPATLDLNMRYQGLEHHFSYGIWRAVHHGYHAFAVCSTIDEYCAMNTLNPVEFYLQHPPVSDWKQRAKSILGYHILPEERLRKVIEDVSRLAEWNWPNQTQGMGFAAYKVFGSYIAVIVKVTISRDERITVQKIWACVDCGLAINPDKIRAQVEGGLLYGLSACLYSSIPKGKDQHAMNFDTQTALRIEQSPDIQVSVIDSHESPTGCGELGVPAIAPAVCNAIRTLRPYRMTELPLTKNERIHYDKAVHVSS